MTGNEVEIEIDEQLYKIGENLIKIDPTLTHEKLFVLGMKKFLLEQIKADNDLLDVLDKIAGDD